MEMFQPLNVVRHFFCNIFGYNTEKEDNEPDDKSEYSFGYNLQRQLRGEYTEEEQKQVDWACLVNVGRIPVA